MHENNLRKPACLEPKKFEHEVSSAQKTGSRELSDE